MENRPGGGLRRLSADVLPLVGLQQNCVETGMAESSQPADGALDSQPFRHTSVRFGYAIHRCFHHCGAIRDLADDACLAYRTVV